MPSLTRRGRNQITLVRALSKFGIASRTQATMLIREGKVKVDGKLVRSPVLWIDPRRERIAIAGVAPRSIKHHYYAFNKPIGVVTTRSDELGRKTVYDALPKDLPWLFPIGRLDKDSSGLLLLANDTRFGNRMTDPKYKVPKTYVVDLDKPLAEDDCGRLHSPMRLRDGTDLQPAKLKIDPVRNSRLELTITEGKYRQIRRMFQELGYSVVALKRIRIGPIELGNLKEGELRALTDKERQALSRLGLLKPSG